LSPRIVRPATFELLPPHRAVGMYPAAVLSIIEYSGMVM
jgi:hypothetical protein